MILIIIAIILLVIGATMNMSTEESDLKAFSLLLFGIGIICFTSFILSQSPTAMDVYRGKTALKITYV